MSDKVVEKHCDTLILERTCGVLTIDRGCKVGNAQHQRHMFFMSYLSVTSFFTAVASQTENMSQVPSYECPKKDPLIDRRMT